MSFIKSLLFILMFICFFPTNSDGATSCDPKTLACKFKFPISQTPNFINYFGNYDISQPNSAIKNLIIVIHGTERNAVDYYSTMYSVAKSASRLNDTLIVAPWFKGNDYNGATNCTDGDCDAIETGETYWSTYGWKEGDPSLVSPFLSSYGVIDAIVLKAAKSGLFPSLQKVTVTGHSAGGQFTQRYSVGTLVDREIDAVPIEFLVANPSSYLYFDNTRPEWASRYAKGGMYPQYGLNADNITSSDFLDPYIRTNSPFVKKSEFTAIKDSDTGASCTCTEFPCKYERYKYGFNLKPAEPDHFMCFQDSYQSCNSGISTLDQVSRYLARRVTYILGQNDNLSTSSASQDLDVTCSANFQGADRLSRGTFYYEYLNRFGSHNHRLLIVPRVAHSASGIYSSYLGTRALFGGSLPEKQYVAPALSFIQKSTGRYLDASTSSPYNAWTRTSESNSTQLWIITKISNNEYTIQQEYNLKYLEASTSSLFPVNGKDYSGSSAQIWIINPIPNESGAYTIQNKATGRYLDADVFTYTVNTQPAQTDGTQKWLIR